MKSKNKKAVPLKTVPKQSPADSLRMVVLVWILSVFLMPVASYLVPGFFGADHRSLSNISSLWSQISAVQILILSLSFAIGLALMKESSSKFSTPKITRTTLIIAAVINVVLFVGDLVFSQILL